MSNKTKRVRIAIAINSEGNHRAYSGESDDRVVASTAETFALEDNIPRAHIVWVEADIPIPESITIQGTIVP